MADKFLQHNGIEVGYFAKRKDQFNSEIAKGLASTGVTPKVQSKKRSNTSKDKTVKNEVSDKAPNQLTGAEFVEKMKLAKEAKAKERAEAEKGTESK